MLHFSVNIDKSEISVLFLNSLIQLFSLFISVCTLLLYVSIKIDIDVKSIGTSQHVIFNITLIQKLGHCKGQSIFSSVYI